MTIEYSEDLQDLSESTCTILTGDRSKPFTQTDRTGNYLHYGIREHGMFGIMNGISAYGCHRVFGEKFLNFLTYGFPAIRIATISGLSVWIIGTHDSIFLGGDDSTHQPIETLALLRATPNLFTVRPANRMEASTALIYSMSRGRGPCAIALTRQKINDVQGGTVCDLLKEGYIISDYKDGTDMKLVVKRGMIRVLLIATGSEVSLAMSCKEILKEYSIRVVSMVSFELFEEQDIKYRKSILADCDVSISIEALSRFMEQIQQLPNRTGPIRREWHTRGCMQALWIHTRGRSHAHQKNSKKQNSQKINTCNKMNKPNRR